MTPNKLISFSIHFCLPKFVSKNLIIIITLKRFVSVHLIFQNFAIMATYKALYDYVPQSEKEMALKKDDIITVLKIDESGWVEGQDSKNNKGWFPKAYAVPYDAPNARSLMSAKKKDKKNKRMSTRFFKRDKGTSSNVCKNKNDNCNCDKNC